jgi:hypothetical protein
MAIGIDSVVVRSSEPLSAAVGETVVLFSVQLEKYFAFDEIATAIWRAIERPVSVSAICAGLTEEFDVGMDRCAADVLAVLQQLEKRKLVSVVG